MRTSHSFKEHVQHVLLPLLVPAASSCTCCSSSQRAILLQSFLLLSWIDPRSKLNRSLEQEATVGDIAPAPMYTCCSTAIALVVLLDQGASDSCSQRMQLPLGSLTCSAGLRHAEKLSSMCVRGRRVRPCTFPQCSLPIVITVRALCELHLRVAARHLESLCSSKKSP